MGYQQARHVLRERPSLALHSCPIDGPHLGHSVEFGEPLLQLALAVVLGLEVIAHGLHVRAARNGLYQPAEALIGLGQLSLDRGALRAPPFLFSDEDRQRAGDRFLHHVRLADGADGIEERGVDDL